MNSLPFISHHLFVAAVGNEGRRQERPTRHDRPSAGLGEQAIVAPLQSADAREPVLEGAASLSYAAIKHVRA